MENSRVFIPVTLKGINYLVWARMTKSALRGRGLWKFFLGSEAPVQQVKVEVLEVVPADEEAWTQGDQNVLSILQSSLESSLLEAYSYCESSKELWDTLKKVYGNMSNLSRVFKVKLAINNLNQEDMEFKHHFGNFRSLWAELEML